MEGGTDRVNEMVGEMAACSYCAASTSLYISHAFAFLGILQGPITESSCCSLHTEGNVGLYLKARMQQEAMPTSSR